MEIYIFVAIFTIAFASVSSSTLTEQDAKPSPGLFQGKYLKGLFFWKIHININKQWKKVTENCLDQPETVDLGKVYDYFTNDANSNRFQTNIMFQVINF